MMLGCDGRKEKSLFMAEIEEIYHNDGYRWYGHTYITIAVINQALTLLLLNYVSSAFSFKILYRKFECPSRCIHSIIKNILAYSFEPHSTTFPQPFPPLSKPPQIHPKNIRKLLLFHPPPNPQVFSSTASPCHSPSVCFLIFIFFYLM